MSVQDVVQDDVEPIKHRKIKGFRGAVQDGQYVSILRIYKRIKSLNFNDSLKNTYNSKNTSHLDFSKGQSDSKP